MLHDVPTAEDELTLLYKLKRLEYSLRNEAADSHILYLQKLWGVETSDYFIKPNFHGQRSSFTKTPTTPKNKQIFLGGYPMGMLQGDQVTFSPDLAPWLSRRPWIPVQLRRDSKSRRWSTGIFETATSDFQSRGTAGVMDSLKAHMRGNVDVRSVWDFLRQKSSNILSEKENELAENVRLTLDTFFRECVLGGDEHPPLCDFVRDNTARVLFEAMQNLRTPVKEKRFRQLRAMLGWANRNQRVFELTAYQHDLRSWLFEKDVRLENFTELPGGEESPDFRINQALSNKISLLMPIPKFRKCWGPLEVVNPAVDDFFTEDQKYSSITSQKDLSKNRKMFTANTPPSAPSANRSEPAELCESSSEQSMDSNMEKVVSEATGSMQPLCWSQLSEQCRHLVTKSPKLCGSTISTKEVWIQAESTLDTS